MIEIKVYKKMSFEDLSSEFVSSRRLETGSLNALTAACAASLFKRAVDSVGDGEREEYLKRNAEILRTYMIHLIDDDVKARAGLEKEKKTGTPERLEAAVHPACSINEEIINMMHQMLELCVESLEIVPQNKIHFIQEAAELAMGAVRSSRIWILNLVESCCDETYKYVVRRENEITLSECEELCRKISAF